MDLTTWVEHIEAEEYSHPGVCAHCHYFLNGPNKEPGSHTVWHYGDKYRIDNRTVTQSIQNRIRENIFHSCVELSRNLDSDIICKYMPDKHFSLLCWYGRYSDPTSVITASPTSIIHDGCRKNGSSKASESWALPQRFVKVISEKSVCG